MAISSGSYLYSLLILPHSLTLFWVKILLRIWLQERSKQSNIFMRGGMTERKGAGLENR